MARKMTEAESRVLKDILYQLYVVENLTMYEISEKIGISPPTVYKRLRKFNLPALRHLKGGYNNTTRKVVIPTEYDDNIAEFFGIMLGDGHVSPKQVIVTLGVKELEYVEYVSSLMEKIFKTTPSIFTRPSENRSNKYRNVYFGSVPTVKWLLREGLVHDKVKS